MKAWARCNNTQLIMKNGQVLTCDWCPCGEYWIVLGWVERPLDTTTMKPVRCSGSSTYYQFAKIENGHICLQWKPQKLLSLPIHEADKDEVIYEWNGCEWQGHNCFNVKFYKLSPCFETYAELTAYFNEKGGDSYFSNLIAGKRLGWNVTADFYSKSMNINTFAGELDEETWWMYRYIFWASGNGEDIKIPYPPGEEEDTELWNSSFEAGAEEVEDMMSTIEADYENFPLAESQYTEDLCHTFSYSFPCGAVGYGGTYGYTMWNTCGLMQLKFSKPSWLNLDCIGVKFKMDQSIYEAYWNQEFQEKSDCPFVSFAEWSIEEDISGYGIYNYGPPICTYHELSTSLELIDYIY